MNKIAKASLTLTTAAAITLTVSGCGPKWEADNELDEAVFLSFVRENGNHGGNDSFLIQEAVKRCEELDSGTGYMEIAERAKTSDRPMYEIAILVGATTWYCPEFDQ